MPLPLSLLPVAAFDCSIQSNKMQPWVEDVCQRMQCPPDYVAVSVMVALGSLIGRKVSVRPPLNDDWSVVANQWALLIGRPGVMKTPTMEEALRPLKMLAATARGEFDLAKAEYEIKAATAKVQTSTLRRKRRGS